MQTSMSPCAVCFSGFFSPASLPDRGASISTHLLRPLGAEAHLALTTQAGSTVTSAVRADILDGLSQLQPIASIEVTPEPSLGWFVRKLEGTPHWVQIVELFNQTSRGQRQRGSGCTRDERMEITNQSSKSPYSCHVRRIVLTRNVEGSIVCGLPPTLRWPFSIPNTCGSQGVKTTKEACATGTRS